MTDTTNDAATPSHVQHYAGADWLTAQLAKAKKPQIASPFGLRVADLLGTLFYGLYHWDGYRKTDWTDRQCITCVIESKRWSTYDSSMLTRLVLLAHEACIRVEIGPYSHWSIIVWFNPRERQNESIYTHHPTIEGAIEQFRKELGHDAPHATQVEGVGS